MKKTFCVSMMILLCGCTPSMVASKKIDSYKETISKLAILVAEPGAMKSTGTGTSVGAAGSRAGGAIADLNGALRNRLAPYLSANGIPSELISATERNAEQYSHRLVITPSSASASCYYRRCQATVRVNSALQDSYSKVIVWTATFDVPEASASHTIDEETADKVGELILEAFRSEHLVSTATK